MRSARILHSATEPRRSSPESFQPFDHHSFRLCQMPPHVSAATYHRSMVCADA
jgi:hypothetical protein